MWWRLWQFLHPRRLTKVEADVFAFLVREPKLEQVQEPIASQVAAIEKAMRKRTKDGYNLCMMFRDPIRYIPLRIGFELVHLVGRLDGEKISIRVHALGGLIADVVFESQAALRPQNDTIRDLSVVSFRQNAHQQLEQPLTGWVAEFAKQGWLAGFRDPLKGDSCRLEPAEWDVLPIAYKELMAQSDGACIGNESHRVSVIGIDQLERVPFGDHGIILLIDQLDAGAIGIVVPTGELIHIVSIDDEGSIVCQDFKELIQRIAIGTGVYLSP